MNLNREQLEDTCNAYGMDISMEHSTRTLDTQYRQYDIYGVYESSRVKIEMPFNLSLPSDYFIETETPLGLLRHLAPVTRMSYTPPYWASPPVPLGHHPAAWTTAMSERQFLPQGISV